MQWPWSRFNKWLPIAVSFILSLRFNLSLKCSHQSWKSSKRKICHEFKASSLSWDWQPKWAARDTWNRWNKIFLHTDSKMKFFFPSAHFYYSSTRARFEQPTKHLRLRAGPPPPLQQQMSNMSAGAQFLQPAAAFSGELTEKWFRILRPKMV